MACIFSCAFILKFSETSRQPESYCETILSDVGDYFMKYVNDTEKLKSRKKTLHRKHNAHVCYHEYGPIAERALLSDE